MDGIESRGTLLRSRLHSGLYDLDTPPGKLYLEGSLLRITTYKLVWRLRYTEALYGLCIVIDVFCAY